MASKTKAAIEDDAAPTDASPLDPRHEARAAEEALQAAVVAAVAEAHVSELPLLGGPDGHEPLPGEFVPSDEEPHPDAIEAPGTATEA